MTFTGNILLLTLFLIGMIIFSFRYEYQYEGQIEITKTKVLGFLFVLLDILYITIKAISFGGIYTSYDTVGEVISVGYKGVTVEYESEYSKETRQIQIDTSEICSEGDTITLQIKCCVFYNDTIVSIIGFNYQG